MDSTSDHAVLKVGVGGPVGSGKTALIEALVPMAISRGFSPVVVTNDIYTQLDAEHVRAALHGILPADRIVGVETGSCPHTAVRDDPTANIAAMEELLARFPDADLLFLESGGDNLTLTFSPTLVDAYIFVIDVAEGDDIPRKKGPGITHSDLLVINKVDLAPYVRVDLDVMRDGAERARPDGAPWVMTNSLTGEGLDQVLDFIATTGKAGRSDNVRQLLEALPPHSHGHGHTHMHTHRTSVTEKDRLLPARYRGGAVVSSAPMGAADLVYDQGGKVAWDQIWGDFCDLAWAGGPPHRGTVLRKGNEAEIQVQSQAYEKVIDELSRGLIMVTGWPVWKNCPPGNIGLVCPDQTAARWLCTAITAENLEVTIFNDRILLLPAGPDFRIPFEIKNVITAVAKTHHYWTEHRAEAEDF